MQTQEEILWQTILGEIQLSVSEGNYKTWFEPAKLIEIDDERIVISHPNPFAKSQFEKRFNKEIEGVLKNNGFTTPKIACVSKQKKTRENRSADTVMIIDKNFDEKQAGGEVTGLNPRYQFENFIVGGCNDLAYAASEAAAAHPGERYNPIFIYGGVGLGKTHLIQAIGNKIVANQPNAKVLYLTAEDFVNDFLDHIKNKKAGFEERYRTIDVLIVDDIQFIAGKEKTQDAFFHTFNALHQQNKQVVLSSDRQPSNIPTLTDRLRSRFQMGMMIDINLPDYETRCAIIESKAANFDITLPRETTEFLAENIKTNIRELEGAINKLLAYCEMQKMDASKDVAVGLLDDIRASIPKHISARQIIKRTADFFELKTDDLTSATHKNSRERQIAMYLMRSELRLSFPKIAREINRKDHTTVMYGVQKVEKAIKLDVITRDHVSAIREKLYV
ncbi:chromosomal replication initiator protein DnaA [Alphaproteobacteria bacterium]|nr:chromosomal replication initiator protein DnaA [Alphaproteobacteria bacterium]